MEKPSAEDLKKRTLAAKESLVSNMTSLDEKMEAHFELNKISKEAEVLESEAVEEYTEKFGRKPGAEVLENLKFEDPFKVESKEGISWEVVPVRVGDMTSKELGERFISYKSDQSSEEFRTILENKKAIKIDDNSKGFELAHFPISDEQQDVLMADTGRSENNFGIDSGRGLNLGKNGWSYDSNENTLTFADMEKGVGREVEINGITYVTEKCTMEEALKFMIRISEKERQVPQMDNAYIFVTEDKIPEDVVTRESGSTYKRSERYPLLAYGLKSQPYFSSFKEKFDGDNHPIAHRFGSKLKVVYKLRRKE